MKRGYKRLLIFELIVIVFLILNSFVSSILSQYGIVVFLLLLLGIFKIAFNFEKDRHRYTKDIIIETMIFLLIYFLLFYLSGLVISFAKTGNYYTLKNIRIFIIPNILVIFLREYLRYNVLCKAEGSKILTISTVIMFIFLDISNVLYYQRFTSAYNVFIFVALTLLPVISENIAASFISRKTGYKPLIIYFLATRMYKYLIPIIPNPNEYLTAIISVLLPACYAFKIYKFYQKGNINQELEREYQKRRGISLIIPTIVIIILVYFTSGYFHYHAVAIASGSMQPNINKGDVVVIEKIDGAYDKLQEGQVIAYKHDGITVVHRLVKIIKIGENYYFYTKGDANADIDQYQIEQDWVEGIVNLRLPVIGYPTVWLNKL